MIEWKALHEDSDQEIPVAWLECAETPLQLAAEWMPAIRVPDPSGYWTNLLAPGSEVRLERMGGEFVFPGVVETVDVNLDAEAGDEAVFTLRHRAHALLQATPCDPYVFDENDLHGSTRDAVYYSPWRFKPHFKRGDDFDVDGNETFLDGVTIKEAYEAAIGVSHSWQLDFQDSRYFLPSQVRGDPNPEDARLLDVYQDEAADQTRPRLQRIRNGADSFADGDTIETIPLMNGSPSAGAMGEPESIEVILIGERAGTDDPTLRACRNAQGTRAYEDVPLTLTTNYLGSGLDAWTGELTFTDTTDESIGLELTIPGTDGDSETTSIEYCRVTAVTASDTGITAGTIDVIDVEGGVASYVDADFTGFNRFEMAAEIQAATRPDPTLNPGATVDAFIDADFQAHLVNRRGSDLSGAIHSLENGDLQVLGRERVGRVVAHRVIAFGGGQGTAEIRVEDDRDFADGGLVHPENDPAGTARYGALGKTLVYRDQQALSRSELRRRARAYAQLHEHPQDFYRCQFTPRAPRVFGVGDSIPLEAVRHGVSGLIHVTERVFTWTPDGGESWLVGLGHREPLPVETFGGQKMTIQQVARNAQPTTLGVPSSGQIVHGEATEFGRGSLFVPEGAEVVRYPVRMRTIPWQVTSKAAASQTIALTSTDEDPIDTTPVRIEGFGDTWEMTADSGDWKSMGSKASVPAGDYDYAIIVSTAWAHDDGHAPGMGTNIGAQFARLEGPSGTNYDSEGNATIFPSDGALADPLSTTQIHIIAINATEALGTWELWMQQNGSLNTGDIDVNAYAMLVKFHAHDITMPAHIHELDYGLQTFKGDTPGASPVLGSGIEVAFNPELDANGDPVDFDRDKVAGLAFGDPARSSEILWDAMNYLPTLPNGVPKPGSFPVLFRGATSANNAEGLFALEMGGQPIVAQEEGK